MTKILIICGPTATGKTALAAKVARKFNGELISADSRQVYQGMNIVTGKDRPKNVKIHGLDLVKPDEDFSVAHFVKYAATLINQIRFPIIVGGTGLYLKSLVNPPQTLTTPPNLALRKKLASYSVIQLIKLLKKYNSKKFNSLNHSDQNNPRRLIRAIEVAQSLQGETLQAENYDCLWIGLTANQDFLNQRIADRVQARIKAGAIQEWQKLKSKYSVALPSMSGIGYRQLPDINAWIKAEQQYARRQLTWFKPNKAIHWFDIAENFEPKVVKLISTWYN